jgi:hypothetical protein
MRARDSDVPPPAVAQDSTAFWMAAASLVLPSPLRAVCSHLEARGRLRRGHPAEKGQACNFHRRFLTR